MWNAVDELLEKSREEGLFPGCALAAGREGQVLYTNACGYLVRDGQQKVSHATRYDVGALTQVLGAMPLCMVAVEKGLFSLDDPITRFLPGVGEDKKSVTILHLLTQTSGLSPHFLLSEESKSDRDALKAVLDKVTEAEVLLGRVYSYAGRNHDVDGSNAEFQALTARAQSLFVRFTEQSAFLRPELLAESAEYLALLADDSAFADYRMLLELSLIHI